jgi:hypothetical protein
MASTLRQTRKALAVCVLTAWICILTAPAPADEIVGYQYQTHRTRQSLNGPRQRHVAARLGDGTVGIFAGAGVASVEIFDPNTESFTTLKTDRWFGDLCGLSLPDGNALLVDGQYDCTFDYVAGQYVNTANTYTGGFVRSAVPVLLPDGKVFLCGGTDVGFTPSAACVLYDPRARQFSSCGRLQAARTGHTAVLLDDEHVLIIGGYDFDARSAEARSLDSLEVFNLKAGTSALVRTALRVARFSHCSVKLADGRVLILGGTNSLTNYFMHSTEIFDPRTSALVDGPDLLVGRQGAQIAVMPSGRVAVFGGQYDEQTIEVFDPNTSSFSFADCLISDARWTGFTATTLNSGAVLIAGGRVNVGDQVLPYAEIFEEIPIIVESKTTAHP